MQLLKSNIDSSKYDSFIDELIKLSELIIKGDFSERLDDNFEDQKFRQLAYNLNTIVELLQIQGNSFTFAEESIISEFIEIISNYTTYNFSRKLPISDNGTVLDAIAAGINMLGEEFEESAATKEELAQEKSKLERANRIAKLANWELNLKSKACSHTSELLRIFDLPQDFQGDVFYEIKKRIHPEDFAEFDYVFRHEIFKKQKIIFTNRIITKASNEKFIYHMLSVVKNNEGSVIAVNGLMQDITERILIEKKMFDTEQRYKLLFNSMSDALIIILNNSIVDFNAKAKEVFGIKPNQVFVISDFLCNQSGKDNYESYENINRKLELAYKGIPQYFEWECINKQAKLFPAEINLFSIEIDSKIYLQFTFRDITERKKMQRQVEENEKMILKAIINTEEKERGRFAEEVHDSLGPLLSGIKAFFSTIDYENKSYEENLNKINTVRELLNEAIISTRTIANTISPGLLADYGLDAAINNFCGKIMSLNKIKIKYMSFGVYLELDSTMEIILYRTIVELVTNTIKHANANNVDIKLGFTESRITLTYTDDGIGLPSKNKIGMGLNLVANRLRSVNGEFYIKNRGGENHKGIQAVAKIKI